MSMFIERTLDTAYGPIELAIVRADSISVEGRPVIRDTAFHTHLHFYRQPDGSYAVRESDRPSMSRQYVAGMKTSDYMKPAPPTYTAKVIAEYTTVINIFMSQNEALADQAESQDIEREIGTAQAKVEEAREKLRELEKTLSDLEAKRHKHQLSIVRKHTCRMELPA